jgi:hypothetical protein
MFLKTSAPVIQALVPGGYSQFWNQEMWKRSARRVHQSQALHPVDSNTFEALIPEKYNDNQSDLK